MRKIFIGLVIIITMLGLANYVLAETCGMNCDMPSKGSKANVAGKAVMANNKYCPVTGEKIEKGHESDVTSEYNGKTYSFCCPACIKPFKADPEKYIKALNEKEAAEAKTKTAGTLK